MKATFSVNDFIEVHVVAAGDDCATYTYDPVAGGLRLSGIHRTATPAPFDLAEVPDSSPDNSDNIAVWLITHRSAFPGAIVMARPIGLLVSRDEGSELRRVIAVPAVDPQFETIATPADLSAERRHALIEFACQNGIAAEPHQVQWQPAMAAHQWIHQARQQARLARVGRKKGATQPAWRPLGYKVAGARRLSETEPNSDAEYAYHQLPFRFQKYVDEYLAPSERILYAVNRPAMKSAIKRLWSPRATLQEGILFLTDQQLTLVTEIVPPDSANIRYGYVAHTSPPERVESIEIGALYAETMMLHVTWRAAGGRQTVAWEFPREAGDELCEVIKILSGWRPRPNDQRLRRATPPEAVDIPLRDPAANGPGDIVPVTTRLAAAIGRELHEKETILARALLPAWVERRGYAEALVVTDRRVLRVSDPLSASGPTHSLHVADIASLEFSMSILESYLAIHHIHGGRLQAERIVFPFTGTGFKECFTTLRRLMAICLA